MTKYAADIKIAVNQAHPSQPSDEDYNRFGTVCAFLDDNSSLLSWRGKNKPNTMSPEHVLLKAKKFFSTRATKSYPASPKTSPDKIVSLVMQTVYGYPSGVAERMEKEHQHAMSAENIVGVLLERYIAYSMEAHQWVWCSGDFVKAVDFIKWSSIGWQAIQVKNRDNTENSRSSAIRNGTDIKKWFRSFSKTGATNWEAFPDEEAKQNLSEAGFREFVTNYLIEAKASKET